jgi:hypothetical protein
VLGSIDSGDLFNDGHLWFGADSSGDSQGWILKSLSVTASKGKLEILKAPSLAVSSKNPESLRRSATANPRNLPIGAAVASYPLFSDPGYRKLVGSQFNLLVPENELKAWLTLPLPTTWRSTATIWFLARPIPNGCKPRPSTSDNR